MNIVWKDLTQRRQQTEEVFFSLLDGSFKVQITMKSLMENKTRTTKNPCFEPYIWGSLWWGILVSWLLLVGLLLVGISGAVLDIGWAWTQSIQVTTILGIIDVILKKHLQWQWCYSQYKCWIRFHILCVDEGTPLSSWRKPFLWGVSQTLPDAEDQFSPAQAALPPPADRPVHHMMEIRHRFLLFARTATNESNPWYTSRQMLQWWLKIMK